MTADFAKLEEDDAMATVAHLPCEPDLCGLPCHRCPHNQNRKWLEDNFKNGEGE